MYTSTRLHSACLGCFGGSFCGATDFVLGWPRTCHWPTPPAPPNDGKPAQRGQTGQNGGLAIVKIFKGVSGILSKPVEGTAHYHVSRCFSKQKCPTGLLQNPRVVSISTRNGSFCPRVCFWVFALFLPSSSSFSLEKERERETKKKKTQSTGFNDPLVTIPRVGSLIHGFFVDCFLSRTQHWRWFAGFLTPIHASTGRNAYTPATEVRNER